jgi:GTP-binding protein HflX
VGVGRKRDLSELGALLSDLGVRVVGELSQAHPGGRDHADPGQYIGRGKVEELRALAKDAQADMVVADEELSARQQRGLEEALGLPVSDRTTVILDTFAAHAHSAEGKLQVELARLEHDLARMRGLWPHLERLGAGIGTRGPGEAQAESDRRAARRRISLLRGRLHEMEGRRERLRESRQASSLPTVALAGYTGAGKSSLMNALCARQESQAGARMFQTLDPVTRRLDVGTTPFLLTDTVGFLSGLPHDLIEAFRSTLAETACSDLILHVADARAPGLDERLQVVEGVLGDIGATSQPRILALNKADALSPERREELRTERPGAILVSAREGEGLGGLVTAIAAGLAERLTHVRLLVPYEQGAVLGQVYEACHDVSREDLASGVRLEAWLPTALAERLDAWREAEVCKVR